MSDETGFRPKFNDPFHRETAEMERRSKEIADRRLNERLRAEAKSKKNSFVNKAIKEVKGKSKKLVGRTFKFVKGNKVTIATLVVAAGAGLAKGATKKVSLHFSKQLAKREKRANMIKATKSLSKYFTGVKAGIIDFMFDTEEWFDETKLGNFINEELDDLEETIYIFIGD